jgi:hypothetical protein
MPERYLMNDSWGGHSFSRAENLVKSWASAPEVSNQFGARTYELNFDFHHFSFRGSRQSHFSEPRRTLRLCVGIFLSFSSVFLLIVNCKLAPVG